MMKYLSQIWELLFSLNPLVTLMTGGVSFLVAIIAFFNQVWGMLVAKLASIILPAPLVAPVLSGFAFVDYFAPVHEVFTFLAAYVAVIGLVTLVRIVKSFIPTVN